MRLFIFLSIVVIMSMLFGSCSKTNKVLEPGISYGITGLVPATVSNGDTLSIYGVGFSADTAGNTIVIHGVFARVITASSQLLKVVVPAAPRIGDVQVKTGSQSSVATDPLVVATVVTGNYSTSDTWMADHLYLLKGPVHFTHGTTLTIEKGVTILGQKSSLASLTIDDGSTLLINGTADSPVVFSSDQAIGIRLPGDWGGITLAASSGAVQDHITYTRIEYAGYHLASQPGAALLINRPLAAGSLSYTEVSYSNGDGFRANASDNSTQYFKYLLSFGCAGNDFAFEGSSRAIGQFLVGIKDPVYADQLGADGLLVQSSQPVTISNLTLVGYSDPARNITGQNPLYTNQIINAPLNPNSGRGVHIGGLNISGTVTNGTLQLFNSLVAASYRAGISLDGSAAWTGYENGGSVIRNTSVTYLPAANPDNFSNNILSVSIPLLGYAFSAENLSNPASGFVHVDNTTQLSVFSQYNDTARLLMIKGPNSALSYVDDLGIQPLVLYKNLTGPIMIPQDGSPLFAGADFTDPRLGDSFFDASGAFRGCFGTTDWTKGWVNYTPQQASYQ